MQPKPRFGFITKMAYHAFVAGTAEEPAHFAGLVVVVDGEILGPAIRSAADVARASLGVLDRLVLHEGDAVLAPEVSVARTVALAFRADSLLGGFDLPGATGALSHAGTHAP